MVISLGSFSGQENPEEKGALIPTPHERTAGTGVVRWFPKPTAPGVVPGPFHLLVPGDELRRVSK